MTTKLVIQADDFGLCRDANLAIEALFRQHNISATSIMPPCNAFDHAMSLVLANRHWDIGIHLTLTCEYPHAAWGPVANIHQVASLVDDRGYFYADPQTFIQKAKIPEVEVELRLQIEKVLAFGIKPTHIDTHMFVCFDNSELFELYLKLAKEYQLAAFISREYLDWKLANTHSQHTRCDFYSTPNYASYMLLPHHREKFKTSADSYKNALRTMRDHYAVLLTHPAFFGEKLQYICGTQNAYGAEWRYDDYQFLRGLSRDRLLQQYDIELCSWCSLTKTSTTEITPRLYV